MSWSLSAVRKSGAVAARVAADFARISYLPGEEGTLKDAATEIVAKGGRRAPQWFYSMGLFSSRINPVLLWITTRHP